MLLFTPFFLLLLVCSSAFFSASQVAFFSIPSHTAHQLMLGGRRSVMAAKLLSSPRNLMVTLLFCDVGANILIQNTAAHIFGTLSSWWLKVGVPFGLTIIFGEVIPKALAFPFNTTIARFNAPLIMLIGHLLGPARSIITWATSHLSNFVFFFLKKDGEVSKEELDHVLRSEGIEKILTEDEVHLARGYLRLSSQTTKERMHPRDEILYYSIDTPLELLHALFSEKRLAKVPIVKKDLQNLIGILSVKEYFLKRDEIKNGEDLIPILKKPYYIPETISTRMLLQQFQNESESMGIVVDEYGAISGLITLEDLCEVIVGEIKDERDTKTPFTTAGKESIITSGKFELKEFEELFKVDLPSPTHVATIGGWLTEQLGEIPKTGKKFSWNQYQFHVLAADPNRIRRLYIRRVKE